MSTNITGKIERKYMAHYIDPVNLCGGNGTPSYYRLGEDLEEFSVELNPDTETFKNILGTNRFDHKGYEPSSESDPFFARVGDALFDKLQRIADERMTGDKCKTSCIEAHLWDESTTTGSYVAYKQDCYVVPTSYGGDSSGHQIPFTITYTGERAKGVFNLSNSTFTPDAVG